MGLKARRARKTVVEENVEFLNVDLEIEASFELAPLVEALGPVVVLSSTDEAPFFVGLEAYESDLDLESTVAKLASLVEALAPPARRLWDECTIRRFSIGIQSGLGPHSTEYDLQPALLSRIAAIDARLNITVYGARLETVIEE